LTSRYVVAPLDEPQWGLDAADLAAGLRDRWPGVRIELGAVEGSSMVLEALIPLAPEPRELRVALSGTGQAVTLEPADAAAAAEFAVWYFERLLAGRTGVHLIEPAAMRTVELTDGLTAEELLARIG
jgi:hypothetical protein